MTIRYDRNLNKEIKRSVDAFNKKVARAHGKGLEFLPAKVSVRELKEQFKAKYATRRELRRVLRELDQASAGTLRKNIELETGQRISLYAFNVAKRRNTRLLRQVNRDIRDQSARLSKTGQIAERQELNRLKDIQEILIEGPRKSLSRIDRINKLYTNEYSASKKDSFENSFMQTLDEQMNFIELDERKKDYINKRLGSMKIEDLIELERNDPDIAEVLDRYKNRNAYNDYDKKVLENVYDRIYENIDNIIADYV